VRLVTGHPGHDWRLHKHADYQRVYESSRKQFSSLMSYFAAPQPPDHAGPGPRIGITAGKVLGKAVERNRIKRRMRAAIVSNLEALHVDVDLVLHPKRNVLDVEWTALVSDVRRVFEKVQRASATRENGNAESGAGERRA
jgi:ribonuclease P protein component